MWTIYCNILFFAKRLKLKAIPIVIIIISTKSHPMELETLFVSNQGAINHTIKPKLLNVTTSDKKLDHSTIYKVSIETNFYGLSSYDPVDRILTGKIHKLIYHRENDNINIFIIECQDDGQIHEYHGSYNDLMNTHDNNAYSGKFGIRLFDNIFYTHDLKTHPRYDPATNSYQFNHRGNNCLLTIPFDHYPINDNRLESIKPGLSDEYTMTYQNIRANDDYCNIQ